MNLCSKFTNPGGLFAIFCVLLASLCGLLPVHATENVPPKRILVISTFHLTHRWTAEFNLELQANLHKSPRKIQVDFLELNAIQRRNIDFEAKFHPYLKNIQNGNYDLLVAILGDAVELLKSNYSRLPADLPIVCVADQPVSEAERNLFPTMTGTCNDGDVLKNIDLGMSLMPKTSEVLIITDDVDSGPFLHATLKRALRNYKLCAPTLLNGRDHTTDQMLDKVSALPRNSFVVFAPWRNFLKDGYFSLEQVALELQKRSPGPYFIITDVLVGKGALGGYVSRGETHAHNVSIQIARIFSGDVPRKIPYIVCPRELIVDMEVMRRFHLSPGLLPHDTILINRKPPFWEVYETECIIFCGAFCCILFLLILLLLYHLHFRNMSRRSRFLLNHGGELAQVSYFKGDEAGNVVFIGGDPHSGIPDDGKKHSVADWVIPEEHERFLRICDRVVSEAVNVDNEIFHSEKSGRRRIYRMLVAGEKYADSYLVVIQDISDTKAAEEAKSYFLTSVSHEIRTPLNAMLGFGELLQNDSLAPEERREYAANIASAGQRLLELVNDILDLSKLETGRMRTIPEKPIFPPLPEKFFPVLRIRPGAKIFP